MKKMLFVFILLFIAGWLGILFHKDPGYVLLSFHHWTIETTAGLAALCLVSVVFAIHMSLVANTYIMTLPKRLRQWLSSSQAHAAEEKTVQGMIAFSEGKWKLAQKKLIRALPKAPLPLLNYLTAARAAQEMGDLAHRDDYLRQAQLSMPAANTAVEVTQAELQMAYHQWEQALATLKHLQHISPDHPYVLKLLAILYQKMQDWPALIKILPKLKRSALFTTHELIKMTSHAYSHMVENLILHHREQALNDLIEELPKSLRNDLSIFKPYIKHLLEKKEYDEAEEQLRRLLRQQLSPVLLQLYQRLPKDSARLSFIESLQKKFEPTAELYVCLAKLNFSAQLWGQAKLCIEKSLAIKPTAEAFAERGLMCEHENDWVGACAAYRSMLKLHAE